MQKGATPEAIDVPSRWQTTEHRGSSGVTVAGAVPATVRVLFGDRDFVGESAPVAVPLGLGTTLRVAVAVPSPLDDAEPVPSLL